MREATRALMLVLVSCWLLGACGFQLRNDRLPERITAPLQISPAQSDTTLLLAKELRARGADIADRANWLIQLDDEKRDKRVIALTSRATPAEYRLSHRLWVSLRNQDQLVVPPTLIEAHRTLVVRPAEAAGMEQEERLLIRELEAEILDRILRWLSFSLREAPTDAQP